MTPTKSVTRTDSRVESSLMIFPWLSLVYVLVHPPIDCETVIELSGIREKEGLSKHQNISRTQCQQDEEKSILLYRLGIS